MILEEINETKKESWRKNITCGWTLGNCTAENYVCGMVDTNQSCCIHAIKVHSKTSFSVEALIIVRCVLLSADLHLSLALKPCKSTFLVLMSNMGHWFPTVTSPLPSFETVVGTEMLMKNGPQLYIYLKNKVAFSEVCLSALFLSGNIWYWRNTLI